MKKQLIVEPVEQAPESMLQSRTVTTPLSLRGSVRKISVGIPLKVKEAILN